MKLQVTRDCPGLRIESVRSRNAGEPSSCLTAVELVDEEERDGGKRGVIAHRKRGRKGQGFVRRTEAASGGNSQD